MRRASHLYRRLCGLTSAQVSDLRSSAISYTLEQQRHMSKLPAEYQNYYKVEKLQPKSRPRGAAIEPGKLAASSVQTEEASTSGRQHVDADIQRQSAEAGAPYHFPPSSDMPGFSRVM
jgi:hypothetical protein